jgi:hypothetical protein
MSPGPKQANALANRMRSRGRDRRAGVEWAAIVQRMRPGFDPAEVLSLLKRLLQNYVGQVANLPIHRQVSDLPHISATGSRFSLDALIIMDVQKLCPKRCLELSSPNKYWVFGRLKVPGTFLGRLRLLR